MSKEESWIFSVENTNKHFYFEVRKIIIQVRDILTRTKLPFISPSELVENGGGVNGYIMLLWVFLNLEFSKMVAK